MRYKNPLIIGVTGGMGSGQSSVCALFEEWGAKGKNFWLAYGRAYFALSDLIADRKGG